MNIQTLDKKEPIEDDEILDPIATLVRERYRAARRNRESQMVGNVSVEQALNNCYRQYNSILDPCDHELVEKSGIDVFLSLTKHKVDVLVAWMRDLMLSTSEAPFVVDPTPLPELSAKAKEEILNQVKQKLLVDGEMPGPKGLIDMVRQMKAQKLALETEYAAKAAAGMQKVIEDQLVEGEFRDELLAFLSDFALYPYAVMMGPIAEMKPVFKWKGNRPVESYEPVLTVRRIDPFDYFWSPDSVKAGKGTFDIVRQSMTKHQLLCSAELPGYIKKNILDAMEHFSNAGTDFDWLNRNPNNKNQILGAWSLDHPVDIIRHFGLVSGRELAPYGLTVEDHKYYEVEAIVLGEWTIKLQINPNPDTSERPIYAASYGSMPGKLPGFGIAQILRDLERSFMVAFRGVLENVGYAIAPLGEVDFSRVQRYIAEDQIGNVMPGTMVPTDPDMAGGGRPAHYFHTVPTVTAQMVSLMEWYTQEADRITGLPAALSGQPVGSGVNRTFRGITMLYGNALKGVQSALTNMDIHLFERLGKAFFSYNMKYNKDQTIKGDAKVKARGASGLLQKELAKQGTQETLQVVAQMSQGGLVSRPVVSWALKQVLESMGVPLDQFPFEEDQAAQQQQMEIEQAKAGMLPQQQMTQQAPQQGAA